MRPLTARQPILVEFLIAFAIVLIVRGSAIFGVSWSQDDFLQIYDPSGDAFIGAQTSMLRASGALVTIIVNWLGASHPTNGSLWSGLHAGSMVVFGLALRQLWIPGSASIYGIANALIFALFPGQSNLWSYQIAHPVMTANYCMAAFALVSYAKGGWRTLASILAIAFALGYQIMLSLFLVATLILLAIRLNSLVFSGDQPSRQVRSYLSPVFALMGCLMAGLVVYFITSKLAVDLSGAGQSSRASLAGLGDVPDKASLLFAQLKQLAYGRGEATLPSSVKLIQLTLLGSVLSASSFVAYRGFRKRARAAGYVFIISLILLAAAISIRIPTILLAYTAENNRVLMGTAVFWSGIFSMSSAAGPLMLKRCGLILGALLVSAYAIITNSICADFVRLNQREMLMASRMVERLAELPDSGRLRTVVLVGFGTQPGRDLRSKDMIWSALNSSMATGVLREASGEDFENPSPADREVALSASKDMPSWPHPGSAAIVGDVGVVVLGKAH
jgi:hypothetical protein